MAVARRASPRRAAVAAAAAVLAACSSTATPPATPPASPHATTTVPAGGVTSPVATPTPAGLAGCPATPLRAAALPVLHRGGQPDDLAADAAGGMWVSDTPSGSVYHLNAAGAVDRSVRGLASPEGIVVLDGGNLLVAEQGSNRVSIVRTGGSVATFTTLPPPPSGVDGVDGIGFDAATGRVLVPDSPHGTLLVAPQGSGDAIRRVAGDLGRPVGAAVGPDGAIYVTAENAAPRGLFRVDAGGGDTRAVGNLRQLDDIVVAGGLLYITDLLDGSVLAVDPASGGQRTIATGFAQPQGLTLLSGGRLAVADSPNGVIRALPGC